MGIYDAVTSEQEAKMVALRIQGKTQQEISEVVGKTPLTVCRHLNKKEIKELIETIRNETIAETLGPASQNLKDVIKNYKTETDKQLKDHGFKASLAMMQGVGVLPSMAQSVTIQQIYNDNRRVEIPEEIREFLKSREEAVAIPAEYEDIT